MYFLKSNPSVSTSFSNFSSDTLNLSTDPSLISFDISSISLGILGVTAAAAPSTDIFVLLKITCAISSIACLKPDGALGPLSGPLPRLCVPVVGTSNSVFKGAISATDAF